MITCDRRHLEARCRERGYSLDEVLPCVVTQDGDTWTIDETHPAYPRRPPAGERPGTVLATLLARVGITGAHGCQCRARAREMDRRGCRWCERNIDTIAGWLGEEAGRRGLPFVEVAARMLVRRAIRTARREANPN